MNESWGLLFMWLGVAIDMLINTVFDPPMGEVQLLLGIVGLQMLLLIGLILMIFLLMARTRLFRAGQVGELMGKYSQFLILTSVHFLLFFGTRIYRVMAVLDYTPHVGIWHLPMFFVLFILQKIVQLVWYHQIIKTARSLIEGLLAEARQRSS